MAENQGLPAGPQALTFAYEGEAHFRRLLEKLPAGAYTCDSNGLITYYNQTAVQIWGRAPKLNNPVDRWCGSFKLFSTDGTPITHDQCWMALALKTDAEFTGREIVVERPDSQRVTALAHAPPIRDASGKLLGAVNVLVDVTGLKQAEVAQARLAAIVESSHDAIVSKTLDGIILSWNSGAERLFGYTADEAVGRPITMIIPPDRLGEEREILRRIRRGDWIDHFETVRVAKSGRKLDISLTVSPIRDSAGRIVAASKVARDISDRKRSEESLREIDRRKDEFLATLAHELRNPLAPIRNAVQILQTQGSLGPALEWARDVIDRQSRQLSRLVDDLLDVSRITRGKLELRKARVELREVLHVAIETSRPLIDASGHEFVVTMPPEPVYLDGDTTRLAQVVANLLNNAAKYTDRGGRIELSAERHGSDAVISVHDTGIGIAPDVLPRVFDRFTQAERSLARAQGGLGVGLTLVRQLVAMHGGSVEAHSEGLGRGSTFTVRLPVLIASQAVARAAQPDDPAAAGGGLRILVVDDNRDAAASLSMLLRIMGHETITAHDGIEAVAVADDFRPDVALLDIGLPKRNGFDVARDIRSRAWGGRVVLIAATGWGQESDRLKSKEAGFDHYLVKPVDPAGLIQLLASLGQAKREHRPVRAG
jgi:PAS domain S-box-containing protein